MHLIEFRICMEIHWIGPNPIYLFVNHCCNSKSTKTNHNSIFKELCLRNWQLVLEMTFFLPTNGFLFYDLRRVAEIKWDSNWLYVFVSNIQQITFSPMETHEWAFFTAFEQVLLANSFFFPFKCTRSRIDWIHSLFSSSSSSKPFHMVCKQKTGFDCFSPMI